MKQHTKGFSLLELMVVVSIILMLTVAGVSSYTSVSRNSRDARRKSDIEQLRQALEMYRADNGYYPAINAGGLATAANLSGTLVATYMPVIPLDPRFNSTEPYQFRATNLSGGRYYGYCVCARLEAAAGTSNTCNTLNPAVAPAGNYNYCTKSP